MAAMQTLRIGGVPEYFNLPILLAIEQGLFQKAGIDLRWQDIPEGTGRMVKSLEQGELDLAIPLTEGMVKSIALGNPSKILHVYVQSPLLWGIHVAAGSDYDDLEKIPQKKFAISRFGSGSHLMGSLLAAARGWPEEEATFEVVNNLAGARQALAEGTANLFLWEQYTTQFLVDKGEFRRIGVFPTPWPCFVVAATSDLLNRQPALIDRFLEILIEATQMFNARNDQVGLISDRYGIDASQVMQFLKHTHWSKQVTSADDVITHIMSKLREVGQLPH